MVGSVLLPRTDTADHTAEDDLAVGLGKIRPDQPQLDPIAGSTALTGRGTIRSSVALLNLVRWAITRSSLVVLRRRRRSRRRRIAIALKPLRDGRGRRRIMCVLTERVVAVITMSDVN